MKEYENYNTGTIQQTCGVPEPTEKQMGEVSEMVDEGFRAFFARNGRKIPHISKHEVGHLNVEQQEMIEAY